MPTPFFSHSIQGAAIGAQQAEQKLRAEAQPQAIQGPGSAFESAVNRADASSQELARAIDELEGRLTRVMDQSAAVGCSQNGCNSASPVPVIAILDELSSRQLAAVQRLHCIVGRLGI